MGRRYAPARYRELGTELRKRREAAGLTNAELADRSGWSMSTISRIETGQLAIEPTDAIAYLGWCEIFRPYTRDMIELCREAESARGFWLNQQDDGIEDSLRSLIYHEATAKSTTIYEPDLVHGLLQTPDYARTRIGAERWRTKEDVDRCVQIRMDRQHILDVRPLASFNFFLHEQVLRREVGSAAVMHEQLLKIVLLTAVSNVTVRVVPSAKRESFAFGGPFRVFEYAKHEPLVYLDSHAAGLFLEDGNFVEPYRDLVAALSEVALDGGQSRELIATMAAGYERGSERDADHHLEEK